MSIVVALCTPAVKPGAVKFNMENIKNCIAKAKKADLIVFPRLAVSGATCGSMYSFPLLTSASLDALRSLPVETDKPVVIGVPVEKDSKVYDAVAVIQNGTYSIYCPPRGISYKGGNEICYGTDDVPPLTIDGIDIKIEPMPKPTNADVEIIPCSCPAYIGWLDDRISSLSGLSQVALVSSGKGESVSGKIMSGDKLAVYGDKYDYEGYDEEIMFAKFGKAKDKIVTAKSARDVCLTPTGEKECAEAYELMGRGIAGRMSEIGKKKVILGLSGGLDSANVLAACVLAFEKYKLDKKDIICVTMRGGASSKRTQDNAAMLIDAFKVTGMNIPIDAAVTLHMRSISHTAKDVVYENAQARERTQILLDLSNKYGALMLGTGDLSEICLGWSTFGGDQLSQYNPNCSLTKTAIRAMLRYYSAAKFNKTASKIIDDILDTPVSPELLSGQETESILGPYEVHDFFIKEILAKRRSPKEVLTEAKKLFKLDEANAQKYINTFLTRVFKYQFKRNFGPDGVSLFPYDLTDTVIRSDFSSELWLDDLR